MGKPGDLVQDTLDLLILKTFLPDAMHGCAKRIQQVSGEAGRTQLDKETASWNRLSAAINRW